MSRYIIEGDLTWNSLHHILQ